MILYKLNPFFHFLYIYYYIFKENGMKEEEKKAMDEIENNLKNIKN
jgi:hypothetical protein